MELPPPRARRTTCCGSFRTATRRCASHSARTGALQQADLFANVDWTGPQNDPLDTLFPLLYSSLAEHQHLSFPPPAKSDKPDPNKDPAQQQAQKDAARVGLHDPDYRAQWHAAAAGLWEEMGASAHCIASQSLVPTEG